MTDLPPPHMKNPTSTLNFHKITIIKTLISGGNLFSRTIFLHELKNVKQTLINNAFPNYIVDTEIKHFINKTEQHNIDNILNTKQSINIYYKNQFHNNY